MYRNFRSFALLLVLCSILLNAGNDKRRMRVRDSCSLSLRFTDVCCVIKSIFSLGECVIRMGKTERENLACPSCPCSLKVAFSEYCIQQRIYAPKKKSSELFVVAVTVYYLSCYKFSTTTK